MYKSLVAAAALTFLCVATAYAQPSNDQLMAGGCSTQASHCLWEQIGNRPDIQTDRANVPGGWLVRTRGAEGEALIFLADPEHKWSASEVVVLERFRKGPFVRLQLVKDQPAKPATNPSIVCPCVLINVREIVAIEEVENGQKGYATVRTTGGSFTVWQTPDEVAYLSQ